MTLPWPSIVLCAAGYALALSALLGFSPLAPWYWQWQAGVGFGLVVLGLLVSGRERA